jgi:hypothetical protein
MLSLGHGALMFALRWRHRSRAPGLRLRRPARPCGVFFLHHQRLPPPCSGRSLSMMLALRG